MTPPFAKEIILLSLREAGDQFVEIWKYDLAFQEMINGKVVAEYPYGPRHLVGEWAIDSDLPRHPIFDRHPELHDDLERCRTAASDEQGFYARQRFEIDRRLP